MIRAPADAALDCSSAMRSLGSKSIGHSHVRADPPRPTKLIRKVDSNVRQIPHPRTRISSIKEARAARKSRKTGLIAAITRNGLASNHGDDKDANATICPD